MADTKDFRQCCKCIFEALERNDRIDAMVADIASALSIAITVVDPCGNILAETCSLGLPSEEGERERTWIREIEEYYAQEDVWKENWIKEWDRGLMVMNPILIKGIVEGFCITHHIGKEQVCELNQMITRTISIGLSWKKQIYGYRDSGARQIVSRILLGKTSDRDDIPKISEDVFEKYVISPYILVLLKTEQDSAAEVQRIRSKISDLYQEVLVCVDKGEFTILFTQVDSVRKEERIQEFIRCLSKEVQGRCAVSSRFDERQRIRGKRKLLDRILKIQERLRNETIVCLENEYYEKLICSYAYDVIGADGYGIADLERLEREDREKGTEFYKSLKEYLLSGNNVNLSAKRLFIHRNTMVYRLSKIHELIETDINQPDSARRLLLTMFLREFEECEK